MKRLAVGFAACAAFWACKPEPVTEPVVCCGGVDYPVPVLPDTPFPYSAQVYPDLWLENPAMNLFEVNDFEHPVTDAGATLGRVLFYDPSLSVDQTISCASCHQPEHGFADPSPVSFGVDGGVTHRNSMALVNLAYTPRLFWDARESDLSEQVLQPIAHPDEMAMDLGALTERLQARPHYRALFADAFDGDSSVTAAGLASALVQFLRTLPAHASRYDAGLALNFSNYTAEEAEGRALFFSPRTRCNTCHATFNFYTPTELMVNGLSTDYSGEGDGGLAELTGNPADDGKFRVVSLRNIGATAPYMHDGRFATLREVVDFYSDGLQAHPQLNHRLSELGFGPDGQPPMQMALTEAEKEALVAFLHTLTDTLDYAHSAWGSPFP